MMLRTTLAAALLIGASAAALAQERDMRQFEGTTLDVFYAEISFISGLKQLLPEFEAKTGIKVNIETQSEAAARQKAQVESATGSGAFDIVGVQSGSLPLYAQAGWLTPVEDYFGDARVADPAQLALDDFIPSTLKSMAYEDKQYCLPFFAATVVLYYQIDKFKEAGVQPPKTFDELLAVAKAVHTPERPAIALRGSPASSAGNIWIYNLFLYGEGGKYFADFPDDLSPVIASPEAERALDILTTLKRDYAPKGSVNFVFDDVVTAMQQGNVVMAIEGAPLAGRILDPAQSRVAGNLGFAVVPGGPAGAKPSFAGHGLCIAAASDAPEAAYMFLEWATSSETMVKAALNSTYLATPRNSVWANEDFKATYNYDFGGGAFLDAYQASLAAAPADYFPPFAAWTLVSDRMGQAVQAAEIGQATSKQALEDAQNGIRDLLTEEGFLE